MSETQIQPQMSRTYNRRELVGEVVSDKMQKSRLVRVSHLVKHPRYGKYIKVRKKYMAHDAKNETRAGDEVSIRECRPLSGRKSWLITKIIARHLVE